MAIQYPLQLEVDLTRTPSDVTLLWRTSSEVLVMSVVDLHFIFVSSFCCCSSFVDVSSFCCCSSHRFSTSSLTLPWTILLPGFSHPILYFQPSPSQSVWRHFHFLTILFLAASSNGLKWAFFTHRRFFTLTLLHRHFITCVYQGFSGSRQFFLEVCRALY